MRMGFFKIVRNTLMNSAIYFALEGRVLEVGEDIRCQYPRRVSIRFFFLTDTKISVFALFKF